jgi:hypothetical protein
MIWPRVAILAVALLLGSAVPAKAAGPQDGIIPIGEYSTVKGRGLAEAHKTELLKLSEHIYHCLPWMGVVKNGIGFPHPNEAKGDDRYLSVWVSIDQAEDPRFGAFTLPQRVSAMFSRYGVDLLRRMTKYTDVQSDANVQGFTVILSWVKPGTATTAPISETIALFADKPVVADFLAQRLPAAEFAEKATFNVFDGKTKIGRVQLDIVQDDFNSTYKLKGYELAKGQTC